MKKWIGIIILIVVLSGVVFYAYQKLHEIKVGSLESIVPEDAIYYLYSYNLDRKIKEFQANSFFGQISTNPVYLKFINPKLEKIRQKIPFLSELTTKDVAFAVFSLGKIESTIRDISGFGDFLFFARVDPKRHIKIKKSIADFYLSLVAKDRVSYKNYKGIRITNYSLRQPQIVISYVFLSDVVVFGNNEEVIKKSIDLFTKQSSNSLLNNKDFQKITARIKKDALLWTYGDTKRYYQEMLQAYTYGSLRSPESRGVKSIESFMKMKPFIDLMNIMQGYASYLDYDEFKKGLVFKTYHIFNRSRDEENLSDVILYDKKVDKNTFNLIPRHIVSYYGGSQDLLNSWKLLKKFFSAMNEMAMAEMRSNPRYALYRDRIKEMSFENAINKLESFLGISIEKDILASLGDNFGIVFIDIKDIEIPIPNPAGYNETARNMPPIIFPQFYSFIELKNPSQMRKLMEEMTQRIVNNINQSIIEQKRRFKERAEGANLQNKQYNNEAQSTEEEKEAVQIKTDSYRDENIYTVEILNFPIDFLRLNYCILDKYIVFSLSPTLTERIIDVYKTKGNSFSSNFEFESNQDNILPDYSNIMFFDFNKMLDDFKSTKFFSSLQSQLSKGPQKNLSKNDLDSVLNLLSNISMLIFTNRKVDLDIIESFSYIKIKGL